MKLKMARNSVFAILLRSSWWISAIIAAVLLAAANAVPNPAFAAVLLFAALPFIVIAAIAGWKQRNVPSAARSEQMAETLREMSWESFATVLDDGFRLDGCETSRLSGGQADFALRRKGRLALVSARRWKASRVGVQALRDLDAARQARAAQEAIYVTLGEVSEQAATYAQKNQIQFMTAPELARLLRRMPQQGQTPRSGVS